MLTVHKAKTEQEKTAIYKLVYSVYCEEMGFDFPEADKNLKLLKDDFDDISTHFYVKDEQGKTIGSVRMTYFDQNQPPKKYKDEYGVKYFNSIIPKRRTIVSRLIVNREHRLSSRTAWLLMSETYRDSEKHHCPIGFCDCSPHLVKTYEGIGWRRFKDNFTDKILGYKVPMVLMCQDIEYFRRIKSPLYLIAKKRRDVVNYTNWFNDKFPEFKEGPFIAEVKADTILSRIANHVPTLPKSFVDLSENLKSSFNLTARKGDMIIRQGEVGNEMYLILDGAVEVLWEGDSGQKQIAILGAGEVFGELAFLTRMPRISSIRALIDTNLLMLSAEKLEAVINAHPKDSANLLLDLVRVLAKRFIDKYTVF